MVERVVATLATSNKPLKATSNTGAVSDASPYGVVEGELDGCRAHAVLGLGQTVEVMLDDVVDARGERGDVVGLDRREHADAQLVAPELAVALGVDDAVGPQHRATRSAASTPSSRSMVPTTWLRCAGSATNGVA